MKTCVSCYGTKCFHDQAYNTIPEKTAFRSKDLATCSCVINVVALKRSWKLLLGYYCRIPKYSVIQSVELLEVEGSNVRAHNRSRFKIGIYVRAVLECDRRSIFSRTE